MPSCFQSGRRVGATCGLLLGLLSAVAWGQEAGNKLPTIDQYYPESMLKAPRTDVRYARFPAIDIHSHFGLRLKGDREALQKYIEVMDRNHIALSVSLDARLGDEEKHLDFLQQDRDRILAFVHIDFRGGGVEDRPKTWACNQPGFVRTTCEQLKRAREKGIVGVKFFKQFGLSHRDVRGELLKIDDPRWQPIWQTCGELGFPILIHTGDPAAFFEPVTPKNERYEELFRHPEWSFHGDQFPSRAELLDARNRVIARNPGTVFIGAHVAGNSEDLETVGHWMAEYPNLYIEIASRIGELGRQPFTARQFVLRHQDRILFGTDGPWPEERLGYYWRFLQTQDEYFPYSEKRPQPQGLWFIYGLNLPDDALKKIYYRNALRILPGIAERYQRAATKFQQE
ncbi:MAG: amidohydrolase [Mariniblastus sp.]|nr:amidohydrolase [Mariniblastus sp.]